MRLVTYCVQQSALYILSTAKCLFSCLLTKCHKVAEQYLHVEVFLFNRSNKYFWTSEMGGITVQMSTLRLGHWQNLKMRDILGQYQAHQHRQYRGTRATERTENLFEEIRTENFPNKREERDIPVQESQPQTRYTQTCPNQDT